MKKNYKVAIAGSTITFALLVAADLTIQSDPLKNPQTFCDGLSESGFESQFEYKNKFGSIAAPYYSCLSEYSEDTTIIGFVSKGGEDRIDYVKVYTISNKLSDRKEDFSHGGRIFQGIIKHIGFDGIEDMQSDFSYSHASNSDNHESHVMIRNNIPPTLKTLYSN